MSEPRPPRGLDGDDGWVRDRPEPRSVRVIVGDGPEGYHPPPRYWKCPRDGEEFNVGLMFGNVQAQTHILMHLLDDSTEVTHE